MSLHMKRCGIRESEFLIFCRIWVSSLCHDEDWKIKKRCRLSWCSLCLKMWSVTPTPTPVPLKMSAIMESASMVTAPSNQPHYIVSTIFVSGKKKNTPKKCSHWVCKTRPPVCLRCTIPPPPNICRKESTSHVCGIAKMKPLPIRLSENRKSYVFWTNIGVDVSC